MYDTNVSNYGISNIYAIYRITKFRYIETSKFRYYPTTNFPCTKILKHEISNLYYIPYHKVPIYRNSEIPILSSHKLSCAKTLKYGALDISYIYAFFAICII